MMIERHLKVCYYHPHFGLGVFHGLWHYMHWIALNHNHWISNPQMWFFIVLYQRQSMILNLLCNLLKLEVSAQANFQHFILPSKSFYSKFRWCNMHIWCSFLNIPWHLRENLLKSWLIYRKLKKNFHFRY